ncbi:MAG: phosphatase [Firmicutes bacterium]|nr:phosphatase [Bacillota bacterium]
MLNEKMTSDKKLKIHKSLTYDILDGMVDWVRVIDRNGVIIYANKTMEEAVGKSLVGSRCYRSLNKECPCKRCITEAAIATGVTSEKEEKIGDKIYSVKSSPVTDANGNIYAAVEVFRDVTRERKLEKEVMRKNKKMSKDLGFSRRLQKRILPEKGNYGSAYIDYIYRPSEVLSGDMFDVFHIDENNLGIYISDVVGHGVSASMMTMFVRQTMRAIKNYYKSPSQAISELHKNFIDLNLDDDKYFTIFYGVINKKDKTFTYVNGGHNSIPLLIRNNDTKLLKTEGFPISYLFDEIKYNEKTIDIKVGDKLLLYTDGILEAKNKQGEQFGLERLLDIVSTDKNCIKSIEEKIDDFNYYTQEDDFAILKAKIID